MHNELLQAPSKDKWKKIGTQKRAGVLAPLFSVYSKNSIGIGDLDDLKLLIDWCVLTGSSILQLLPMNDAGPTLCPYGAVSSFALEPVYISLRSIAGAKARHAAKKISALKALFPTGRAHIDYKIKEEKLKLLWDIYLEDENIHSEDIEVFKMVNGYWIDDFALFKALNVHHKGKPWYEWEDKYKNRDRAELAIFAGEHKRELGFQVWIQRILHKQLKDVKDYAESKKVLLKGDLPILISRDSADVWARPHFFKMEYAAGAPPDMYCAKGQRWGMPTYNWGAISSDGHKYLKEKLKYAENFYDMLRIDHVVGLFRIWSIPYDEPFENGGLNGFFDPKDERTWGEHGKEILSVILNNTKMLICAEDLGIIPKVCHETLEKLGIPGNDVQRWTKDWKIKHDFLKPDEYRFCSVAMLSTHDTTNWAAWWECEAGTVDEALFVRKCSDRGIDYCNIKDKLFNPLLSRHGRLRWLYQTSSPKILTAILGKREDELRDFIDMYQNNYLEKERLWKHLGLKGPMREKSDSEIAAAALKITLKSRSIFCIELITDLLNLADIFEGDPYQYRINTPATISEKNWSMTIPISLEGLLRHKVSGKVRKMVKDSSRRLHG